VVATQTPLACQNVLHVLEDFIVYLSTTLLVLMALMFLLVCLNVQQVISALQVWVLAGYHVLKVHIVMLKVCLKRINVYLALEATTVLVQAW